MQYKKKTKAAPWTRAFPKQVKRTGAKLKRTGAKLKRSGVKMKLSRAKWPRPISPQRRLELAEYARLKKTWWVFNWGDILSPRCPADHVHHTWGRTGALLNVTDLWVPVSQHLHDWIERNRDMARRLGLLCPEGRYNSMPTQEELAEFKYGLTVLVAVSGAGLTTAHIMTSKWAIIDRITLAFRECKYMKDSPFK